MKDYIVFDLEMTGLQVKVDKIIEIGAVKVLNHQLVDTYQCLVNPRQPIPQKVAEITGITNEMVADAMDMDQAVAGLLDFIGDLPIVGHNVSFDYSFIKQWAVNQKRDLELPAVDTLKLARRVLPGEQSKKLESLCTYYGIERQNAHRALDDAMETWQIYERLCGEMQEKKMEPVKPQVLAIKIKKQTPATARQIQRLKEYRQLHGLEDEIIWETLSRGQASRLMDQYISKYGR